MPRFVRARYGWQARNVGLRHLAFAPGEARQGRLVTLCFVATGHGSLRYGVVWQAGRDIAGYVWARQAEHDPSRFGRV